MEDGLRLSQGLSTDTGMVLISENKVGCVRNSQEKR